MVDAKQGSAGGYTLRWVGDEGSMDTELGSELLESILSSMVPSLARLIRRACLVEYPN